VSLDADSEFDRLNALRRYAILDTPPEGVFDRITALAAEMLEVPIAVVSLVDTNRVWYKSVHGPLGQREIARLPSLCGAGIAHEGPYVVESARGDPRAQEHPLVSGPPELEFYVGVPLRTFDGHALGMLSCMDHRPRGVTPRELRFLETLAAIVMDEIELRRSAAQISRLSEALAETCTDLERRASFDALTGVLSRSAVLSRGAALLERTLAGGAKGVGVFMADIDRFKAINDGYGHAIGDRVLKEVASRLAASCRGGDLLGRVGGEEFLALFPDVSGAEASAIAERLRDAVSREPVALGSGASLAVSISAGLVTLGTERPVALEAALARADAALYAAKAEGRNRIVTVAP
jgi:diguanylate cyclase (GGDEF)-like protein